MCEYSTWVERLSVQTIVVSKLQRVHEVCFNSSGFLRSTSQLYVHSPTYINIEKTTQKAIEQSVQCNIKSSILCLYT